MFSLFRYIPSLNTLKWASLAFSVALAWFLGHQAAERALRPQLEAARAQVRDLQRDLEIAKASQKVVTQYVDRIIRVKEAAQVITKEIPVYVTPAADRGCVIPAGFVRLHDKAASGPDAPAGTHDPAPEADPDQPSGVQLHEVASTVADNYATYHAVAAQLTALQQWVKVQTTDGTPASTRKP